MMRTFCFLLILVSFGQFAVSQDRQPKTKDRTYPPQFQDCQTEIYKTVRETELKLYIFSPDKPSHAPAIVFFFGGGWSSGTPQQFEPQCRKLSSLGMVAITADYRVASRHNVKPTECLADARSAVRWIRQNSEKLGIDPNRIAAAGGSAGGHLAASCAFIDAFDAPTDDKNVSAEPNALVLFNPALVLAPLDDYSAEGFGTRVPKERLGTEPKSISPAHHATKDAPPTIIFHGTNDTTVPSQSAEVFTKKMKSLGNRCDLKLYPSQKHGFFNGEPFQTQTLEETIVFLTSLGWLKQQR